MPIYEYQCPKCGEFEVMQRISESPLKKCPTCKGKVRKLISNTSFQLKGSGWYVTDYGRSGAKADTSKADSAAKSGETKTETSSGSESKADSKPEKSSPKGEKTTTKSAAA